MEAGVVASVQESRAPLTKGEPIFPLLLEYFYPFSFFHLKQLYIEDEGILLQPGALRSVLSLSLRENILRRCLELF